MVLAGGGQLVNRGLIEGAGGGVGGENAGYQQAAAGAAGVGVSVTSDAAATVTNAGTIAGVRSVVFASASDTLIAQAGARFVGDIDGGGGTLLLAGGAGAIAGLGGAGQVSGDVSAAFAGSGAYTVGAGGHWSLTGTNLLGAGQTLIVDGRLAVSGALNVTAGAEAVIGEGGELSFQSGDQSLDGSLANSGVLSVRGGVLTLAGAVSGSGQVEIRNATLAATSTFNQDVVFGGKSAFFSWASPRPISRPSQALRPAATTCSICATSRSPARARRPSRGRSTAGY